MLQAKKGKEAQTPFCQAELQNNLKLDTDPSRYRKFSTCINISPLFLYILGKIKPPVRKQSFKSFFKSKTPIGINVFDRSFTCKSLHVSLLEDQYKFLVLNK